MLPSHLNLKFEKKGKETDGFINLMREFHWTLDELRNLPLPTAIIIGDYFKRQSKK